MPRPEDDLMAGTPMWVATTVSHLYYCQAQWPAESAAIDAAIARLVQPYRRPADPVEPMIRRVLDAVRADARG